MSVTKLRRFLSRYKDTGAQMSRSDDPRLSEGSQKAQTFRKALASRITRSKRNGSWFRLSKMERGILSLALRLQVTFGSLQLAKALVSVLRKLAEIGDSVCPEVIAGTKLASSFSDAAVSWGNEAARAWRVDRNYALFLGRFVIGVRAYR